MKSSQFCLLFPLVVLLFLVFPQVSYADDPDASTSLPIPHLEHNISYVCVQFKDFPLMVLWHLKGIASSIKQELPEGLSVGREKRKDQGYLLVSYQQKKDGVLLSMSLHRLTVGSPSGGDNKGSPSLLSQQRMLCNPSNKMIVETLRNLFSSFLLSWEKSRMPMGEDAIALCSKKLDRPS